MSKVQEITHQVAELFRDFGIKSLTMDDISSALGISKKTLYKYVSDKNDLVNKVISTSIEQKEAYLIDLIEKNNHPIDELVSIAKFSIIEISSLHPTVQFDLKKYHPKSWMLFEHHKQSFVFNCVVNNLKAGIKIKVYRENIDPLILARLHTEAIPMVFDSAVFPPANHSFKNVFSEFMRHYIRGIATNKGLEYLKELIKTDTNNLFI